MASKNPRKDADIKRKDLYYTENADKIRIVPGLNPESRLRDIEELMGLIRASGRIDALLCRRNTDSDEPATWDLIGGHRRFESFKRLKAEGWEGRLGVEEITCTDAEMIILATLDNMGRKDFSPIEEAEAVVKMERMGWTDAQISEKLDRSLPWVAERKALYTASPEVKAVVKEEGLAADIAADIARAGGNEKQKQILEEAKAEAQQMSSKKKGKGRRKDWRQNMRKTVGKRTGKKLLPGKRLMRQVQQEVVDAIESEEINGESKLALVAIDFALGEITLEEFRDALDYEVVEVDE